MSLWKNLFGSAKKEPSFTPNNTRLMALLVEHGRTPSPALAKQIQEELVGPNAVLLLPTDNEPSESNGWRTAQEGESLRLASVFDVDGLKVLGVWTDEESLVKWSKRVTPYTAMPAKALLETCEAWKIGRVVINSDEPTMFVLEAPGERFNTRVVKEETQVQVGTPSRPLDPRILEKLKTEFAAVESLKEAFHYAQSTKDEFSLMIGLKMEPASEAARSAALVAINAALKDETLDQPVDVFMVPDPDWYETLVGISGARFYVRG